jgi:hypothetical protein
MSVLYGIVELIAMFTRMTLGHILCQINLIRTLTPYFFKTQNNIIGPHTLRFPKWYLSFWFAC